MSDKPTYGLTLRRYYISGFSEKASFHRFQNSNTLISVSLFVIRFCTFMQREGYCKHGKRANRPDEETRQENFPEEHEIRAADVCDDTHGFTGVGAADPHGLQHGQRNVVALS